MCNCGKSRTEYSRTAHNNPVQKNEVTPVPSYGPARFEYIGKTALSVLGNVTGKNYRFNYPGDIVDIDYRDLRAILRIPALKRMT